jgi:WD40 repeat protein
MPEAPTGRPNPYPGPRAFLRGEDLYGRERETVELLDLLIAERIVLLYSPSGAGKTSLIQAALMPALEREGFRVLPPMRPGFEAAAAPRADQVTAAETAGPAAEQRFFAANRYILSLLLSLEEALPETEQMPTAELARLSLLEYLDRHPAPTNPPVCLDRAPSRPSIGTGQGPAGSGLGGHPGQSDGDVLIFDQFEEVLIADPTDRDAKIAFFEQVGAALRDRRRWALFSMREEFVAGLDPYLRTVPTRFATTYRLELLGRETAIEAMQKPARTASVEFTDDAAAKLADDLRAVRIQHPDGTAAQAPGQYVEPVQLQVVCRRLWDRLALGDPTIDAADVENVGDVDTALRGYYADQVAAIAAETGIRERAIREWVDRQLIESGLRGQVLQTAGSSQGLDNRAIWPLVDAHLVRAEQRRGATWFELAHDRLIEPVRADNAAWLAAHLSTLQRQAALWESRGRSEDLLMRGQALAEAEQWATAHPSDLTATEQAFLAQSQEAREVAQKERRQAIRFRRLFVAATASAVLALALLGYAIYSYLQLQRQAEIVTGVRSRGLAAQAQNLISSRLDLALLLGREADTVMDTPEARGSLLNALEAEPQLSAYLRGHDKPVSSVAYSPDGHMVAAGSQDGTIILWDPATALPLSASPLRNGGDPVTAIAFSPVGKALASGSDRGDVFLWNLGADPPAARLIGIHETPVGALSFSPDGRLLASHDKHKIVIWDLASPTPVAAFQRERSDAVQSTVFSPDGRWLAIGSDTGVIEAWEPETGRLIELSQPGLLSQVSDLAFSPDARLLAVSGEVTGTGSSDTTTPVMLLFENKADGFEDLSASHWEAVSDPKQAGGAMSQAYAPDGRAVASWQELSGAGHTARIESIAFNPDGKAIASASRDGTVRLWDATGRRATGEVLRGHQDWVLSVAYGPDGQLASGGEDGNVLLWQPSRSHRLAHALPSHRDEVWAVAASPDGRWLASGSKDTTVKLYDLDSGVAITLTGHTQGVRIVRFRPDSKLLASGSEDGTIILWDTSSSPPAQSQRMTHSDREWVTGLAFTSDDKALASSGSEGTIKLWDLTADPPVAEDLIPQQEGGVWNLAISPDGRLLAIGDNLGSISLFDLATRRSFGPQASLESPVMSLAFSRDGRYLAAGTYNDLVTLWEVPSLGRVDAPGLLTQTPSFGLTPAGRLLRHTAPVSAVGFSPDGGMLASSSYDGTTILWDLATRQQIGQPLAWDDKPIDALAFTPDGRRLAVASDDGSVILWNTDQDSWRAEACRIANRELSPDEWQQFLGDTVTYRRTCSDVLTGSKPAPAMPSGPG